MYWVLINFGNYIEVACANYPKEEAIEKRNSLIKYWERHEQGLTDAFENYKVPTIWIEEKSKAIELLDKQTAGVYNENPSATIDIK